jgi:GTP pyrophosphokinase
VFTQDITIGESTERFVEKLREINPKLKIGIIKKAYQFSWQAHKNQLRKSGEPFLAHPVAVAFILAEQNLDPVTIASGLLHDVLEDTAVTFEELKERFSEEVALLVDGVTKIDALQAKSREDRQVETYRKMLLSMARDLRVIIIKFADRLHNLRTLKYLAPERIKIIASETLDIYAPLAHRLGMAKIKLEMEDLAFKYLHPEEYNSIVSRIVNNRYERETILASFVQPLQKELEKIGIKAAVVGRPKHFYSIFRKMEERNKPFEEIYDLLALRVITPSVQECYLALGTIHSLWKPLQDRFKDHISTPKPNGYQSLHTTVIGQNSHIVEIQIRTWAMNETAEDGIAAHWLYKEDSSGQLTKDDKTLAWLKNIIEWQKDLTDSTEFYEFFKIDLYHAEIFVFTPKGDLITLPKGATVLDFAFAVHTQLGMHCIGARVDGKIESVSKVLKNGCTIEILHQASKTPLVEWLRDVKTPKARSAIKRWLNVASRQEGIALGKNMLSTTIDKLHVKLSLSEHMPMLLTSLGLASEESLYELLGKGEIPINRIMEYFFTTIIHRPATSRMSRLVDTITGRNKDLMISSNDTLMIRYGRCCNPVPGDDIVGFITNGRGISVHRKDCPNTEFFVNDADRAIAISWDGSEQQTRKYRVLLDITASNRSGLFKEIACEFAECNAEILEGTFSTDGQVAHGIFQVEITNRTELKKILRKLQKVKGVEKVVRTRDRTQINEEQRK